MTAAAASQSALHAASLALASTPTASGRQRKARGGATSRASSEVLGLEPTSPRRSSRRLRTTDRDTAAAASVATQSVDVSHHSQNGSEVNKGEGEGGGPEGEPQANDAGGGKEEERPQSWGAQAWGYATGAFKKLGDAIGGAREGVAEGGGVEEVATPEAANLRGLWTHPARPYVLWTFLTLLGLSLAWSLMGPSPPYSRVPLSGAQAALFQSQLKQLEDTVSRTVGGLQAQVDVLSRREEAAGKKVKGLESKVDGQLKKLSGDVSEVKAKVSSAEAVLKKLSVEGAVVSRQEVLTLAKSVVDQRAGSGTGGALGLEDVRTAARKVVLDELERHSADRLGRPDHAVYAGGGRVLAHSAAWHTPGFGGLLSQLKLGLHPQAQKVVTPSHGEPGHCLPLKVLHGKCGHVDIALRTSVVPEAVTLEHVSKATAFDLSTAPKAFRISGWHMEPAKASEPEVLGTFEYDIGADHAAQTFSVKPGPSASMSGYNVVRLEVLSNHGSDDFTCIYRLRVHGIPIFV